MVDNDRLHGIVVLPLGKSRAHCVAHIQRQRMERLGPVKRDMADGAVDSGENLIGHYFTLWLGIHCRSKSRPTTMRMIWLVPSRIEWTRRSRQKRSMG